MKLDKLAPSSTQSRKTIALFRRALNGELKSRFAHIERLKRYGILTYWEAERLRKEHKRGLSISELAFRYNISPRNIYNILSGKTHRGPKKDRKLTQAQAELIRKEYGAKGGYRTLARKYGVSVSVIRNIIAHNTYTSSTFSNEKRA